jgi:phage-related protein
MTNAADFRMQPEEVAEAIQNLDKLADRVENLMTTEAPNLDVTAPAGDEVSQRVATTLNDVHATFAKSAGQGTNEMREIAATLRAHTGNVLAAEQEFVV